MTGTFLAGGALVEVGSNAYLLTSRQIVERLQYEVYESFFHRGRQFDEGEILEDVKEFADKHGLVGHRIRRRHKVVPLKIAALNGVVSWMDPDTDNEAIDEAETEKDKKLKEISCELGLPNGLGLPVWIGTHTPRICLATCYLK